jgi:hypothetical protein
VAGASSNVVSSVLISSNVAVVPVGSNKGSYLPVSSNAAASVPPTINVATSPAATTAPSVASGSIGLTNTITGGPLRVTGAANLMRVHGAAVLFGVLLATVILFYSRDHFENEVAFMYTLRGTRY